MLVAGADEAGRGPWAGPIVSAVCILPKQFNAIVKDSKILTEKKREEIYKILTKNSIFGIGIASCKEIDDMGIVRAFELSIKRALAAMPKKPDFLLIDGRDRLNLPIKFKSVVDGDSKIACVSAASILAKVSRDHYMMLMSQKYPQYAFNQHKGYGTKKHIELLEKFGVCEIHRKSFQPIKQFVNVTFKPKLLLHACCAPCATSVIERLKDSFKVSVYFFNPNIQPFKEYKLRLKEIETLCKYHSIDLIVPEYKPKAWFKKIKQYKNYPEGSKRCTLCYAYRLYKTALFAKKHNFEYFTTTLSVSPLKKYEVIKHIGKTLQTLNVKFLDEDFKKKDGFKRSCELSKQFNFYRQNYCGCIYSYRESINRKFKKQTQSNTD
ncbi:MAG TPA: ribonuclease HII [Desulfurella acetivorans]|uniref:Multifunctional fusion protein n=1 Tax=Desulfurella acetivorans TaxID=33002 RepID=A0A7C6EA08_DESAE|nr:ribonuclease HII [Desulfurella acetivorans]